MAGQMNKRSKLTAKQACKLSEKLYICKNIDDVFSLIKLSTKLNLMNISIFGATKDLKKFRKKLLKLGYTVGGSDTFYLDIEWSYT